VGLATERDQLTGWKDGLGDVLPIVGAGSIVAVPKATQNSSFEWTWQKQYLLTTLATGFGTVSPDTGVDGQWVNANTTNTISAVADAGYVLDAWKVNGVTLSHKNDNFNLVMTGVMRVEAVFIPAGDRYIPGRRSRQRRPVQLAGILHDGDQPSQCAAHVHEPDQRRHR
jgi:hypothetical protein